MIKTKKECVKPLEITMKRKLETILLQRPWIFNQLLLVINFTNLFVIPLGGIENISEWFQSIEIPGFSAYIVAAIELLGGLAFIMGNFTRTSALLAIILMIATLKVNLGVGFVGNSQMAGYEFELSLFAIDFFLLKQKLFMGTRLAYQ